MGTINRPVQQARCKTGKHCQIRVSVATVGSSPDEPDVLDFSSSKTRHGLDLNFRLYLPLCRSFFVLFWLAEGSNWCHTPKDGMMHNPNSHSKSALYSKMEIIWLLLCFRKCDSMTTREPHLIPTMTAIPRDGLAATCICIPFSPKHNNTLGRT